MTLTCPTCGELFTEENKLEKHLELHSKEETSKRLLPGHMQGVLTNFVQVQNTKSACHVQNLKSTQNTQNVHSIQSGNPTFMCNMYNKPQHALSQQKWVHNGNSNNDDVPFTGANTKSGNVQTHDLTEVSRRQGKENNFTTAGENSPSTKCGQISCADVHDKVVTAYNVEFAEKYSAPNLGGETTHEINTLNDDDDNDDHVEINGELDEYDSVTTIDLNVGADQSNTMYIAETNDTNHSDEENKKSDSMSKRSKRLENRKLPCMRKRKSEVKRKNWDEGKKEIMTEKRSERRGSLRAVKKS